MKTTKLITLISATALLAGGVTVLNVRAADKADATPHRRFGGGTPLLDRAKEKLGLSDSQVEQIKAAVKDDRENIMSLVTRFREARVALREAIQSKDASESSVRAAAAKVAAVEADIAVQRLKLSKEIRPILTEEQLGKFAEIQAHLDGLIESGIGRMRERLAE